MAPMPNSLDETLADPTAGSVATESDPAIGHEPSHATQIGRYVVIGKLGVGGMGIVFAAYDPELDRKVALKLLHARTEHESARARLQREAQALAKLNHENVVAVHDVGVHGGRVFVAMEFVAGETLGAWMKAAPRSWRDVVPIFAAAGRGLAAAHAAGLVHRDFKPENVMIGADGRVRVMDFGLARAGEDELPVADTSRRAALDGPLTQTGAVMGTPAYMSPEQFAGAEVTPRSDQFAFCVALHEAIYGRRPFSGNTLMELAAEVTEGRTIDPPRARGVPNWLRDVMRRGLMSNPAERFPDMPALLAALGTGEARRRRQRIATVIGGLFVVVGGVFGWQRWDEAKRIAACETEGDAIDEIWNEQSRAQLQAGLLASEAGNAASIAEKVMPWFDAQAEALRDARTATCLYTRVSAQWSEDLYARANWCLDERGMELAALVSEFSRADRQSIQRAITAASRLSRVDPCRDEILLARGPAPPEAPEAVVAIRRSLSESRALQAAGKYAPGLELAKQSLTQAQAIDWPPLVASARIVVATALDRSSNYPEAETMFEDAYFEAVNAGATELAVEAATALVVATGDRRAHHDEALRWARHLDATLNLLGEPEDGLRRAGALDALALAHKAGGVYESARDLHARALAIRETQLGSEHPELALSLNNLANVEHATGRYDEAEALHQRALSIRERAFGPDHPDVATSLVHLANAHQAAGDLAEALSLYERAAEIYESALGSDSLQLAICLSNLAGVYATQGDNARARPIMERTLVVSESAFGREHPNVAIALANLAHIELTAGEYEQARAHYERALSIVETTMGKDHSNAGFSLNGLSEVALHQGRHADAIALAERAIAVRSSPDQSPHWRETSRFMLARALWAAAPADGGDRSRALRLAEEVRDASRAAGREDEAVEVEAWLAELP
jgi:tetratricopeptide (TPR) repeat protein/predicted Ser/Thr protein kinase